MTLAPLQPTRTLNLSFYTGRTLYGPEPTIHTIWNGGIDVPAEYRADLVTAQIVAASCLGLRATKASLSSSSTKMSLTHPSAWSVSKLSSRLLLTEYMGLFYIGSCQSAVTTTHDLPIEDSSMRLKTQARRLLLFNLDHNGTAINDAVHLLTENLELNTEQLTSIRNRLLIQTMDTQQL